jgi:N-acetylglucosaminylphosphatidylinositol deacetylase
MNKTEPLEDSDSFQQSVSEWLSVHFFAASQVWKDFIESLVITFTALSHFLLLYTMVGALAYYFYIVNHSGPIKQRARKRVLFVIAHPDDECMFFGPTILKLIENNDIYVLCLTVGNHYDQGSVRKGELYKSCTTLGILQSNIMIMNNTRMPDNPKVIWSAKKTSRILLDHIESLTIDEVFTFDIGGVSGHLNHASVFYAFARLCLAGEIPKDVTVFLLDSVNKVRKYSLFLDTALSVLPFYKRLYVVSMRESGTIRKAMHQHKSQMVWYRFLYIYLSRYMYVNAYKELESDDVQLVLQMADYNPTL